MQRTIGLGILSLALVSGSTPGFADSVKLHDLIGQGYEIKAEAIKANLLTITVQKGTEAFICATTSDLMARVFNSKPVTGVCAPL